MSDLEERVLALAKYRPVIRDGNSGQKIIDPYDNVDHEKDPEGEWVRVADLRALVAKEGREEPVKLTLPEAVEAAKGIRDRAEKRRREADEAEAKAPWDRICPVCGHGFAVDANGIHPTKQSGYHMERPTPEAKAEAGERRSAHWERWLKTHRNLPSRILDDLMDAEIHAESAEAKLTRPAPADGELRVGKTEVPRQRKGEDMNTDKLRKADDIAAHIWTDVLGARGDYAGWMDDKAKAAKLIAAPQGETPLEGWMGPWGTCDNSRWKGWFLSQARQDMGRMLWRVRAV
jgi:hypothetical protein